MRSFVPPLFLFVGLVVSSTGLMAQDTATVPSGNGKLRPLEVRYTTLGGLQYSLDGFFLTDFRQFREVIDPLGDFEASRMLRKSEDSDLISRILSIAGFLGLATGVSGLLFTPSEEHTGFWFSAVGGSLVFNIGGLFRTESQTAKFNSVQRYNRFARGEEQKLPQTPADEKALIDFTPATGSKKAQ